MNKPNIKLVKYVFLDVVGYSRRIVEIQARIISALNEIVRAALDEYTIGGTDRVLIPTGDGLCIGLLTATDDNYDLPVRVALSILRRLAKHNEHSGEDDSFQVRIGIDQNVDNLVTDINGNLNVAGTGINMAARIMDLADSNQILVSQTVHSELYTRELYHSKLRKLPVVNVKHGVPLQVFQYVQEDFPGLDCNLPTKWRSDLLEQGGESAEVIDHPAIPAEPPAQQGQVQAVETVLTDTTPEERQSSEQQIAESLGALGETVKQEELVRSARFTGDLDEFHLLRIQLLTSTWLATQIPSSMLGTHEANRLYLNRERLRPSGTEFVSLLRILINDHLGYIPGWYWFEGFEYKEVETVILHIAFTDPHNPVRQLAFDLLSSARVPLSDAARERMAKTVISDSSPYVRRAALSYIGSVGDHTYLSVVGSARYDRESTVSYQAKVSGYLLLARAEPERALSELLGETGVEAEDILNELLPKAGEVSTTTLLKALENSKNEIRFFAIKELAKRGELTVELATSLKEDKHEPVKAAAYRFLVERGVDIEPEDIAFNLPNDYLVRHTSRNSIFRHGPVIAREQIVLEFYRRYDVDQLMLMADWDQLAGREAYRVLALEHFSDFAEKLREDLRTDFAEAANRYYQQRLEEWQRIAATPPNSSNVNLLSPPKTGLFSGFQRLFLEQDSWTPETYAQSDVKSRKDDYTEAALAGLARNSESPDDVEFGRRFLFHGEADVRIEAIRIIKKFGNADDVTTLVEIAKSNEGLLQELAAQTALTISGNPLEVANEFLVTGDEILVSITIAELIAHGNKEIVSDFLRQYLYSDNEKIRTHVMAFFVFRYDKQELENLLAQYIGEAVYYYDVVCCFDIILYASPRLTSFYRKTIEDSFWGLLVRESASPGN